MDHGDEEHFEGRGRDDYSASPPQNPREPETGAYRVLRGGSFFVESIELPTSARSATWPSFQGHRMVGFRVVRESLMIDAGGETVSPNFVTMLDVCLPGQFIASDNRSGLREERAGWPGLLSERGFSRQARWHGHRALLKGPRMLSFRSLPFAIVTAALAAVSLPRIARADFLVICPTGGAVATWFGPFNEEVIVASPTEVIRTSDDRFLSCFFPAIDFLTVSPPEGSPCFGSATFSGSSSVFGRSEVFRSELIEATDTSGGGDACFLTIPLRDVIMTMVMSEPCDLQSNGVAWSCPDSARQVR